MYLDNSRNIENFDLDSAPVDFDSDDKKEDNVIDDTVLHQGPIGRVPKKVDMKPPGSMTESLNMLQGAPLGDNYMLLSADMMPGIKTLDSAVPVAYPRVGGHGNLGKDSPDQEEDSYQGPDHAPYQGPDQGLGQDQELGQEQGQVSGTGKSVKVVLIYAPWCGWSKKSLPDFEKMEDKLNGVPKAESGGWDISCELYNSEDPVGKRKVEEYEVKGFPAVFVEVDKDRQEGPREYSEMIELVNSVTGGKIQP